MAMREPNEETLMAGRPIAALLCSAAVLALATAPALAHGDSKREPLVIEKQGSFAAGGTFIKQEGTFDPTSASPVGMTLYGDHAYVQYQIPVNARKNALVMWHGGGQMGKTWEQTVDGREGYQSIFLRRDFPVYILDQPRRGRAGNTTVGTNLVPTPSNETLFMAWRLGVWPNLYPNSQFPKGPEALEQFWRMMTPDTGPGTNSVIVPAVTAAIDKIGPSVLLTHSASGLPGWLAGAATSNIKGIYAYEPTGYVFPEGEVPPTMGGIAGTAVPLADFLKLTKIPIVIIHGDFNDRVPSGPPRLANSKAFVDLINAHGGNATNIVLPDIGIRGNSHVMMLEENNDQVADVVSKWLKKNRLDKSKSNHDDDDDDHHGGRR
jgi:hypothetical protein